MGIKIDLSNQIRQTILPRWKPLLPLFEAMMNSFQAIKEVGSSHRVIGEIIINVEREEQLFKDQNCNITGFIVRDNGIGLDDRNFESFNTAYSSHKTLIGGKGLGRFIYLKAFDKATLTSTFLDERGNYLTRHFTFDQGYDLDERGLPKQTGTKERGTTVHLMGLRPDYRDQITHSTELLIQKVIEHFILIFLEEDCPIVTIIDAGLRHNLNQAFKQDYRANASVHKFSVSSFQFIMHGFRLPTSRIAKHKLVYAADQRAVQSDKLEDYVPNLRSKLEDQSGRSFFYLGIVQSKYLSEHVSINRTYFDFPNVEDLDAEIDLFDREEIIPKALIREKVVECVQEDLKDIIDDINTEKLNKVRNYVAQEAPQYRILLKLANQFLDRLSPNPTRADIEAVLHRELFLRETELKKQSTRIIKEAEKIDDYETYSEKFSTFLNEYNELGASALAQYVQHRKIILEFLERAINLQDGEKKFPLEKVVHQLVFPMQTTSDDIPYSQQNLWMIDERLTYHSFISSDKQTKSFPNLSSNDIQRGDIVIFDEKVIFSDDIPTQKPLGSIVVIEFKRPGRTKYSERENPVLQAASIINAIRAGKYKVNGRFLPVANDEIPASIFCVADLTPKLRQLLVDFDASVTPDKQGYYGYHRTHKVYYEVMDYTKMLRDALKRNRIFFEKLNLVGNR